MCRKDGVCKQRRLSHGEVGREIAFRKMYPARAYTTLVVLVFLWRLWKCSLIIPHIYPSIATHIYSCLPTSNYLFFEGEQCRMLANNSPMVTEALTHHRIVPNGTEWYQIILNGPVCYRKVPNGTKWCWMVPNGTKWCQMVQNGAKSYRRMTNGAKW